MIFLIFRKTERAFRDEKRGQNAKSRHLKGISRIAPRYIFLYKKNLYEKSYDFNENLGAGLFQKFHHGPEGPH